MELFRGEKRDEQSRNQSRVQSLEFPVRIMDYPFGIRKDSYNEESCTRDMPFSCVVGGSSTIWMRIEKILRTVTRRPAGSDLSPHAKPHL
jgi:hypothetical protein